MARIIDVMRSEWSGVDLVHWEKGTKTIKDLPSRRPGNGQDSDEMRWLVVPCNHLKFVRWDCLETSSPLQARSESPHHSSVPHSPVGHCNPILQFPVLWPYVPVMLMMSFGTSYDEAMSPRETEYVLTHLMLPYILLAI